VDELSLVRKARTGLLFVRITAVTSRAQTLTTLVNFTGANGAGPAASVIQAADGNFYGTTFAGGRGGAGTVFKVSMGGVLTTLTLYLTATQTPR
jgi:uncharacterized repeat protein (TIGR03803 family)